MHADLDKSAHNGSHHRMQKRIALDGKREDVLAKGDLMAKLGPYHATVRRFAHGRGDLAKALKVLLAQKRRAGGRHRIDVEGIAMPPHGTT